jgi:hypothetical protein
MVCYDTIIVINHPDAHEDATITTTILNFNTTAKATRFTTEVAKVAQTAQDGSQVLTTATDKQIRQALKATSLDIYVMSRQILATDSEFAL